jgi:mono/diheme cytochrome c family protein
LGEALFHAELRVVSRHQANGVPASGTRGPTPTYVGLGPATIDFWVDSGRMPAANPRAIEANRRRFPRLTPDQALAVAAWVNSLDPSFPDIPTPN